MFDSAKLDNILSKEDYKKIEPQLRDNLLNAQFELLEQKKKSVLILLQGADGVGKGRIANILYSWLDARHVYTLAYDEDLDNNHKHPHMWKYWRDLPAYGEIGIVLGTWYHDALAAYTTNKIGQSKFAKHMDQIKHFETMLTSENVLLLKIWLHMDTDEAQKRLEEAKKGNRFKLPTVLEWRELKTDKERKKLTEYANSMAYLTSTGEAPWHIVTAKDFRYCAATIGHLLLDLLQDATKLQNQQQTSLKETKKENKTSSIPTRKNILTTLDLSLKINKEYKNELNKQQERISLLTSDKRFEKVGLICAFEGTDAAGKGGAIRRLRDALDLRQFQVVPTAAPTEEERSRPYLWRFWRKIPTHGKITIFDRTWYGRVLVERVEGFCSEADWRRAYDEINHFEEELYQSNYIIAKFWLAISQDEQLKRFKERENTPYKRFKITEEDWRNRDKQPEYLEAINDMIDRTNTPYAPWTLVEAEDKHYSRVKVLKTIADMLEKAL